MGLSGVGVVSADQDAGDEGGCDGAGDGAAGERGGVEDGEREGDVLEAHRWAGWDAVRWCLLGANGGLM
jgi:hypothetical protein